MGLAGEDRTLLDLNAGETRFVFSGKTKKQFPVSGLRFFLLTRACPVLIIDTSGKFLFPEFFQ